MGKQEGKKLTNKGRNSEGRQPPKYGLPQAPPKEGMCLAGYGMLGIGEMEGERFKAKSSWVNSQKSKVWWSQICFITCRPTIC